MWFHAPVNVNSQNLVELEEKLARLIQAAAGYKTVPSNEQLVVIGTLATSYAFEHEQILGQSPPHHPLRERKKFLEYVRGRASPQVGRRAPI